MKFKVSSVSFGKCRNLDETANCCDPAGGNFVSLKGETFEVACDFVLLTLLASLKGRSFFARFEVAKLLLNPLKFVFN